MSLSPRLGSNECKVLLGRVSTEVAESKFIFFGYFHPTQAGFHRAL